MNELNEEQRCDSRGENVRRASTGLAGAGARDATRGGVNVAALPRQRGRESPLSIDAWTEAKARGVQVRDLQRWIDARKRIYGF
jgi:hypothetical protein